MDSHNENEALSANLFLINLLTSSSELLLALFPVALLNLAFPIALSAKQGDDTS